ncbi:hypothetical protein SLNWT_6424 [Streptomyces albus]|uniref:Uncharacterized protein n=1 Tax=Streptomyces albus (strain ATCC 21838 / DSM 41398 / FERM P-419 / JCM 4703 / NBRC 107858) TaxID=1081613 RepID=A0A0B5F5G8_STRA4|nr:hypothetical protein SLNWT_6424 [Streptomyces albus]AOU81104.1 hypothetical protein SLNHY_6413 [Streptomyces albus]AYN36801.1 hypothetical protein DUI70_6309 [Streptomyces albus]
MRESHFSPPFFLLCFCCRAFLLRRPLSRQRPTWSRSILTSRSDELQLFEQNLRHPGRRVERGVRRSAEERCRNSRVLPAAYRANTPRRICAGRAAHAEGGRSRKGNPGTAAFSPGGCGPRVRP